MKFTKMQGLGNDYVYVDCTRQELPDPEKTARIVSDRHFGIGSDGLILICPSDKADFEMRMYNADGSRGEMCGNGIRCVAKYVYDYGLTDQTSISVETLGGIKYLDLTVEHGKVSLVKVDMGTPILEPSRIPVAASGTRVVDEPLEAEGKVYHMTCVSMGNPHEFVKVLDQNTVEMRVWERGSGETLACGTGACAVAVASILNGYTEDQVTVRLLGGDLEIFWDRAEDKVYMTGPAKVVFDGEICLEA